MTARMMVAPAQAEEPSFPLIYVTERESSAAKFVAPAQAEEASFPLIYVTERESSVVKFVAPAQAEEPSFPRTRESSVVKFVAPAHFGKCAGAKVRAFSRHAIRCFARALAVALLLTSLLAASASARTLAEVQGRGLISMCAHPDALPHASDRPDAPGFQIEIGRALAAALGFPLQVDWIVARMRAGLVDCDLLLDTIADPDVQRGPVKLSHAYQKSGVALALRPGNDTVHGFGDLRPEQRVGVMVGSVASVVLGKRGLHTVPYSFESEMVEDLAKGTLDAGAVSPASIAYYIHVHPGAGLRFVHAYDAEPELRWNLAVGLRRSDDALVAAVNVALDKLIDDGTLARIYAKYGVDYRRP